MSWVYCEFTTQYRQIRSFEFALSHGLYRHNACDELSLYICPVTHFCICLASDVNANDSNRMYMGDMYDECWRGEARALLSTGIVRWNELDQADLEKVSHAHALVRTCSTPKAIELLA